MVRTASQKGSAVVRHISSKNSNASLSADDQDKAVASEDLRSSVSTKTPGSSPLAAMSPKAFTKVRFGPAELSLFGSEGGPEAGQTGTIAVTEEQASAVKELLAPHDIGPWVSQQKKLQRVRHIHNAVRNNSAVELMMSSQDGHFVAVKLMPRSWMLSGPQEFAQVHSDTKERPWVDLGILRLLTQQAFEYSLKLEGIYQDNSQIYVVTTFADQGDLFDWSADTTSPVGPAREAQMRPLVLQIFEAVRLLHSHGIAHRDVCLENFVLATTGGVPAVKVIDFGMACVGQWSIGAYGGKGYQAPEMHVDSEYDAFLSDAFSIGVVLFGMATHDYPWRSTRPDDCKHFNYVVNNGLRKFYGRRQVGKLGKKVAEVLSADMLDLLEQLLAVDAPNRVSLGEDCYGRERRSVWASSWLMSETSMAL